MSFISKGMANERPITYVDWNPDLTTIKPGFFNACTPLQAGRATMVVNAPVEMVERIVARHGQTGLTLTAGRTYCP